MSSYPDEELAAMGLNPRRERGGQLHGMPSGGVVAPLRAMDLALLSGVSPSAVAFVIGGAIPENEVTLLTAPGGGNKTTLALMLLVAMAARLETCLGLAIEPAPAIYVGLEDSEGRLHWMLHHICAALGVQIFELVGLCFCIIRPNGFCWILKGSIVFIDNYASNER